MIITSKIITNLEINSLKDLKKIKPLAESSNLKINYTALSKELNVDRRTVKKYVDGYERKTTRTRSSSVDVWHNTIKELLDDRYKVFSFRMVLYRYLKDNYDFNIPLSTFTKYLRDHKEFDDYFTGRSGSTVKAPSPLRFETDPAQQAQLEWKESMTITLNSGEEVEINIFVLLLSYSRYRIYRLSLTKTQDVLFHFLNDAFETLGGVPKELLTDNMKTVMDESRTPYSKGKVNNKFAQFASDYGFTVKPCIAARPQTKAKVESPMRILEELKAYGGQLDMKGLNDLLVKINNRENSRTHEGYSGIPLLMYEKEKDLLNPLPSKVLRSQYSITTTPIKVNQSSMIVYKNNQYSVPAEYIGKRLTLQVYDNQLHLYYNTKLVTIHSVSQHKLNYVKEHYIELLKKTLPFDDGKIEEIAKDNLNKIGERYR